MKWLAAAIALVAPLAVMGAAPYLGDQRLAVIDDPLRVEFHGTPALTKEKIHQVIAIVAPSKDWKVLADADDRLVLTRTANNKHVMRIELVYDVPGYVIRYLDSSNLMYRELKQDGGEIRAIHRSYNTWIRELASAVNAGLGISASFAVSAAPLKKIDPVPAAEKSAAAPAAGKPASERLPEVGALWRYSFRDQKYRKPEQFFSVDVTGVDGWTVHERHRREHSTLPDGQKATVNAQALAFGTHRLQPESVTYELAPYLTASEPGAARVGQVPAAPNLGVGWRMKVTSVAADQTIVPAGNFKTIRVDVTGEAANVSSNILAAKRFSYTAWYAPEAKRYVMLRHQVWNGTGVMTADDIVRLVEYRPN